MEVAGLWCCTAGAFSNGESVRIGPCRSPLRSAMVVSNHGHGLFVPKPSYGADCERCGVPDLGMTVRQRPLTAQLARTPDVVGTGNKADSGAPGNDRAR